MADWKMKGQYLKNCSCLSTCPCDTTGYPAPNKFCEGASGMNVQEGHFGEVDLSGLKWAVSYHWPGALHEGNGTMEVFVDERANEAQRNALLTILSGKAGGSFFEIIASIVTTVHGPYFVKIDWEFDKERRRARLAIPGFVETTSESLTIPSTKAQPDEQRVIVRMPGGFEYKEMEVAQTGILKGTGEIKFDWHHTHSSLAEVEHTPAGLAS
jgi:hypothetical protein